MTLQRLLINGAALLLWILVTAYAVFRAPTVEQGWCRSWSVFVAGMPIMYLVAALAAP